MPCSISDFFRTVQLGQTGNVYTFTVPFVSDVITEVLSMLTFIKPFTLRYVLSC
jgi:hypothetical protein